MASDDGVGPNRDSRYRAPRPSAPYRRPRNDYAARQLVRGVVLGFREVGMLLAPDAPSQHVPQSTTPTTPLTPIQQKAPRGISAAPGEPALPSDCHNCGNARHADDICPLPLDPTFRAQYKARFTFARNQRHAYRKAYHNGSALPVLQPLPWVPAPRPLDGTTASISELDASIPLDSASAPSIPATPAVLAPRNMPPPNGPSVAPPIPSYTEGNEVRKFITWVKLGMGDTRLEFTQDEKNEVLKKLQESWMTRRDTSLLTALCEQTAHGKGYHFQDPTRMHPTPWTPDHPSFGIPAFIRMGADPRGALPTDATSEQPLAAAEVPTSLTSVTEGMENMEVEQN